MIITVSSIISVIYPYMTFPLYINKSLKILLFSFLFSPTKTFYTPASVYYKNYNLGLYLPVFEGSCCRKLEGAEVVMLHTTSTTINTLLRTRELPKSRCLSGGLASSIALYTRTIRTSIFGRHCRVRMRSCRKTANSSQTERKRAIILRTLV